MYLQYCNIVLVSNVIGFVGNWRTPPENSIITIVNYLLIKYLWNYLSKHITITIFLSNRHFQVTIYYTEGKAFVLHIINYCLLICIHWGV